MLLQHIVETAFCQLLGHLIVSLMLVLCDYSCFVKQYVRTPLYYQSTPPSSTNIAGFMLNTYCLDIYLFVTVVDCCIVTFITFMLLLWLSALPGFRNHLMISPVVAKYRYCVLFFFV